MQIETNAKGPSLVADLESSFVQAASTEQAEIKSVLEEMAKQGRERKVLNERGWLWIGLCLFFGLILFGQGFNRMFYKPDIWVIIFCLLIGGGLTWWGATLFLRTRKPIVTLTEKGMLFADLKNEIPWTAVEDWRVSEYCIYPSGMPIHLSTSVSIYIDENHSMPTFSGDKRAKYSPNKQVMIEDPNDEGKKNPKQIKAQKNLLLFKAMDFSHLDTEKLDELFDTYINAARARQELAKME